MLRIRLLYGLLTLAILLWAVGAAGIVIFRDADVSFRTGLEQDYEAIRTAGTFRIGSSVLNSNYATALAAPSPQTLPERRLYDETVAGFHEALTRLRAIGRGNERWMNAISGLEAAVKLYEADYSRVFSGEARTQENRAELLKSLGNNTQRITDLSGSLISLAEERLFASSQILSNESLKNIVFIGSLVILGTGIATLIYFQLLHHLVDPVVGLRDSIEEVSMGNFELTLPTPSKGSEFTALVTAFNSMAAELQMRRRESDERLVRNNMVNRALLSAIPSPVYVLDPELRIVQLNPAAEQLNELLGLHAQLPTKVKRLLLECRNNGRDMLPEDAREAVLYRISDEERYYLPRIFRFADEAGEFPRWAVFLQDVTRIRWLDDMKTNMLATVSHEIKTPLTGIRMVLHLLLEEHSGKLTDLQRKMLTSATGDCERLLITLNSLLDLSKAESGTTQLDRRPIDLGELAQESADLFRSQAASSRVGIRVDPGENLPLVFADPIRIAEVMHNLISNAIKHSPPAGQIEIRLVRRGADYLRLSVMDDGPGVPDDLQVRIFERFFRAPDQQTDGVGLGLFISREIMRAHEGRIGLGEPEEHQPKTEFFIDVPLA
jgi:NtrC-family two-component system sensor histidine kinase KinB